MEARLPIKVFETHEVFGRFLEHLSDGIKTLAVSKQDPARRAILSLIENYNKTYILAAQKYASFSSHQERVQIAASALIMMNQSIPEYLNKPDFDVLKTLTANDEKDAFADVWRRAVSQIIPELYADSNLVHHYSPQKNKEWLESANSILQLSYGDDFKLEEHSSSAQKILLTDAKLIQNMQERTTRTA